MTNTQLEGSTGNICKPHDCGVKINRKQSTSFLAIEHLSRSVVAMDVLDRAKQVSGISTEDEECLPYVCLACETEFEVQYHRCPDCESFDVRYSKWNQQ